MTLSLRMLDGSIDSRFSYTDQSGCKILVSPVDWSKPYLPFGKDLLRSCEKSKSDLPLDLLTEVFCNLIDPQDIESSCKQLAKLSRVSKAFLLASTNSKIWARICSFALPAVQIRNKDNLFSADVQVKIVLKRIFSEQKQVSKLIHEIYTVDMSTVTSSDVENEDSKAMTLLKGRYLDPNGKTALLNDLDDFERTIPVRYNSQDTFLILTSSSPQH